MTTTSTQTDLKKYTSGLIGIPTLFNTEKFFDNLSNEKKARTGYSHIMHNLSLADFLTCGVIALKNNRNLVFALRLYETSLPHLEFIALQYPQLDIDLKYYLPRLKYFSEKISQLKPIYDAYKNAFGGAPQ